MMLFPLLGGIILFIAARLLYRSTLGRRPPGNPATRRNVLFVMLSALLLTSMADSASYWYLILWTFVFCSLIAALCSFVTLRREPSGIKIFLVLIAAGIAALGNAVYVSYRAEAETMTRGDEIMNRAAEYVKKHGTAPALEQITKPGEVILTPAFKGASFYYVVRGKDNAQIFYDNPGMSTCTRDLRDPMWTCWDGV